MGIGKSLAGAGLVLFALAGSVWGQVVPGERTRGQPAQEQPRAGGGREGGIPRGELGGARGGDKEGQEEGIPDVPARTAPGGASPRWIAPRGDWKLGVWTSNSESGVVVARVAPGSAAARVGIESGDRIVSVGGYQVGYVGDLLYPLGFELQRQAGQRGDVLLLVQNVRNKELMNLSVQLDRGGRERLPATRQ